MMDALANLVQIYGLPIAISIVFVWQSLVRDRETRARIDALADRNETTLVETVNRNTLALETFTRVISAKPCGQALPPSHL